ncbi:hypothetical protein HIM_08711 [Hirsutella minnesotensis 3608]|uniref:Extracellular membrane protein CFEM domain-containing protein n=1 Tax=Hirsutella minnesotensis 3608 TaxID=1043627 RepID=A0A0F7ZH18_9HYPO|nr:hypothetical protein HIM_09516 [Hirsutella minnesotensis 3608]KJZ71866.1 hypothetical protein HIM_08711 [Hirsutella minnesotensis 3608]
MKYSTAVALVSASLAHGALAVQDSGSAGFDYRLMIQSAGPLLQKAKCAAPCVSSITNALSCNGTGPLDTICNNVDAIKLQTQPCAARCGITNAQADLIAKTAKVICLADPPKVSKDLPTSP